MFERINAAIKVAAMVLQCASVVGGCAHTTDLGASHVCPESPARTQATGHDGTRSYRVVDLPSVLERVKAIGAGRGKRSRSIVAPMVGDLLGWLVWRGLDEKSIGKLPNRLWTVLFDWMW